LRLARIVVDPFYRRDVGLEEILEHARIAVGELTVNDEVAGAVIVEWRLANYPVEQVPYLVVDGACRQIGSHACRVDPAGFECANLLRQRDLDEVDFLYVDAFTFEPLRDGEIEQGVNTVDRDGFALEVLPVLDRGAADDALERVLRVADGADRT